MCNKHADVFLKVGEAQEKNNINYFRKQGGRADWLRM